jgi:hypothetical protein
MITRGRAANHLYISVVGDGNPHAVIQPDSLHLRTATELLEQILARGASPHSATTLHREQHDPAARLGAAAAPYLDALHLAADHLTDPQVAASLDQSADHLLKGLTSEPAWPTLRGHLLLLAAAGADPVAQLFAATATLGMASDHDQAAVIDSRIHDIKEVATGGRCPGCRAFPTASLPTAVGAPTWLHDQTWSLSSQTKSATIPRVKRRPGRSSPLHLCRPS